MKPTVACNVKQLPVRLRGKPHWVTWKLEAVEDRPKPAKMPYDPRTGKRAKANDLTTWASWGDALAALQAGGYDGLGWYALRSLGIVLIDLDRCVVRADTGLVIAPWATAILERFPRAYAEYSQSGEGIHLVVFAPGVPFGEPGVRDGGKKGDVEIYGGRHYLALTGHRLADDRADVAPADVTAEVTALGIEAGILEADARPPSPPAAPRDAIATGGTLTDEQVLAALGRGRQGPRRLALYHDGDEQRGQGKDSERDYEMIAALCEITVDDAQVQRLLLASPLKRKKWGEKRGGGTWLTYSIGNARRSITGPIGGGRTYRLLHTSQLRDEPEPPWLLPGVLPAKALAVFYGASSSGKSFIAIDWALSLAAAGHRVAYVAAEGWEGTKRRVEAWRLQHALPAAPELTWLSGIVNLLEDADVAAFLTAVRGFAGDGPELVVIDTLNQNMPGGDENAAADMTAVLAGANRFRREGATVLIIHHPRKADEVERGHSSLRGAADTMIKLTIDDATDQRVLTCTKQKDGALFDPRRYALREVNDPETGRPVSLVAVPTSRDAAPAPAPAKGSRAADVLAWIGADTVKFGDVTGYLVTSGLSKDAAQQAAKRVLAALVDDYRALVKLEKKGGYRRATDAERDAVHGSDDHQDRMLNGG